MYALVAEPLLYASSVPFLVLFVAFMMKRELETEWNRLPEEALESELAFNLVKTWSQFARRIRSWIGRRMAVEKAPLQRGYSAVKTVPHAAVILGLVQQAETSLLASEKQGLQEPPQRRSIFPGAASVHNAKEQPKPWDESQWID
jgi:hypothetical protein